MNACIDGGIDTLTEFYCVRPRKALVHTNLYWMTLHDSDCLKKLYFWKGTMWEVGAGEQKRRKEKILRRTDNFAGFASKRDQYGTRETDERGKNPPCIEHRVERSGRQSVTDRREQRVQ
eukprot:8829302-Lingulodinium_polyedra.AAC.1